MKKPLDIILEYGSYENALEEHNKIPDGQFLGILDNYWYYKSDLTMALKNYEENHNIT